MTALVLALAIVPALAEVQLTDIALDSKLELREVSPYGSYGLYDISITVQNGVPVIVLEKDGEAAKRELSLEEVLALWEKLLEADIDSLGDAPTGDALPDGSHFAVRLTVSGVESTFAAYSVDSIGDLRYRTIVREILALADEQLDLARDEAGQ